MGERPRLGLIPTSREFVAQFPGIPEAAPPRPAPGIPAAPKNRDLGFGEGGWENSGFGVIRDDSLGSSGVWDLRSFGVVWDPGFGVWDFFGISNLGFQVIWDGFGGSSRIWGLGFGNFWDSGFGI